MVLGRDDLQEYNVCSRTFRVKEYIRMGLDKNIDPDKGSNIARELERLKESGVNEVEHLNLQALPMLPNEG